MNPLLILTDLLEELKKEMAEMGPEMLAIHDQLISIRDRLFALQQPPRKMEDIRPLQV